MRKRNTIILILVILLAAVVLYVDLPITHPGWVKSIAFWQQAPTKTDRPDLRLTLRQGLDLQGGSQVLLQAMPVTGQALTGDEMETAKIIVERRVNALGVTEPLVQLVQLPDRQGLIVELPGISDPDQAVETLRSTGQLEFVEIPADTPVGEGQYIRTSNKDVVPDAEKLGDTPFPYPDTVFETKFTGRDLKNAQTSINQTGEPQIDFELSDEGATTFATYTAGHIGGILAIVLDNIVLSAPQIQSEIPSGQGQITGSFTLEEARNLAVQMRYGALPVPLEVMSQRNIGPTLGADSVRSSILAGLIGLIAVLLFMSFYYRLPGLLAAAALVLYAGLNLALYKAIPVTLTLPGIAGFLLSTGMAVDANILIFERMKEELRAGRTLQSAVEAGFNRAWTSIFDSNLSTLITCLILIIFGRTFGAQSVMGFAVNLAIGVVISMFSAITVTRTFMRAVFGRSSAEGLREKRWLLGF